MPAWVRFEKLVAPVGRFEVHWVPIVPWLVCRLPQPLAQLTQVAAPPVGPAMGAHHESVVQDWPAGLQVMTHVEAVPLR